MKNIFFNQEIAVLFFVSLVNVESQIYGQSIKLPETNMESINLRTGNVHFSDDAAALLVRYIQFPSVSGREKDAGIFLRNVCEEAGLNIRQFGDEDGHFNFAASLYPLGGAKPNLIFLNHIDVVPAGDEAQWQQPPFAGLLIGDEIWGRGAFDNKGVAIMQLCAIAGLVERSQIEDLPFNVTFLAVSCEETQCDGGARFVAENHLHDLNPFAIIGEGPPSLQGVISSDPDKTVFGIATGHKCAYWLKLDLELQTSGHGSVTPIHYSPREMVIALERMLSKRRKAIYTSENIAILRDLGRLEGGIKGFLLKNPRIFKALIIPQLRKQPEVFALFSNTVTLTNISNSTSAHNTIPANTTCLLDCRLLPQTDKDRFLKNLMKKLANEKIIPEVVMQTPNSNCSSISHPVYHWLKDVIQEYYGQETQVVPLVLPNLNDSGWFREKGIPVFDIVPARISRQHLFNVHNTDERIPLSTLTEGAEVFTLFLDRIMDSGVPDNLLVNRK